ncbi:RNA recognition motif domain containing protein [Aphelenchoides bicaudatus]|nr:RNA recognition motif domain containing protein [Aphelenchoides bicaudatus]
MYNQQQSNFFLPDGLSNSSSSSIESAFNLGCSLYNNDSGFPSQAPTPQLPPYFGQQENSAFKRHLDHVINGKEGKMFIGGLSWLSTTESMRAYFEKFGPVEECVIMRDAKTKNYSKLFFKSGLSFLNQHVFKSGLSSNQHIFKMFNDISNSRGFGFVTFENPAHIKRVLSVSDHFLDGKKIDPQIAIRHISPARSVNNISRKVFIGGVSQQCTVEDVKNYFSKFGQVEDAILKMDYPKQQHRGFGFMTFVKASTADFVCFIRHHTLKDKVVECKLAEKKEFVKPNGEAALAASTFLNSLPPEQVLAIYGVLVKSIVNNGPQHQQFNSMIQTSAANSASTPLSNVSTATTYFASVNDKQVANSNWSAVENEISVPSQHAARSFARPPATATSRTRSVDVRQHSVQCLASSVYYESSPAFTAPLHAIVIKTYLL